MHVKIHEYAEGGRAAFELSDDGRELLGDLDGQLQVGKRICALVNGACESTEQGYDRLREAIDWLTDEIKKRKEAEVRASA